MAESPVEFDTDCTIFSGLAEEANALMSHNDTIYELPEGFKSAAHTDSCPVAAMYNEAAKLYGMQFHPEVTLTENGHCHDPELPVQCVRRHRRLDHEELCPDCH